MSNPFSNAGLFLIQIVFYFFILLFVLRLLFKFSRVNPYNPVSIFIFKFTQPFIKPLRPLISLKTRFDIAVLIPLLLLEMIKLFLTVWVSGGSIANYGGLFIWGAGDLLSQVINVYFYAIVIYVILSWVAPHNRNPLVEILDAICAAILAPAKRIVPPLGGFDLSPILVIILLQLVNILLSTPLIEMGSSMSFGQVLSA